MPQQKPLNDAELAAFEDSMDFDALLLQSANEMAEGNTHVVYAPAIEARRNLGLSQEGFARVLDVSPRTLQQWEQGRRKPSGAARALVAMALKVPQAFVDAGLVAPLANKKHKLAYSSRGGIAIVQANGQPLDGVIRKVGGRGVAQRLAAKKIADAAKKEAMAAQKAAARHPRGAPKKTKTASA
ncbi:DNA-binding transcriptional regulator YiaG [Variovorax boronicumulans]|uniref:DNA-binding transcriptional regulator YiaG n=1 Tax=Variovorax boronicumulans TaxID=436515 RepID=A0AAW8D957_9BURK|nr:helix-turn-helix domain-containing protein [Variovorax boronicumulans]MDP9896809.1 DNA-binding transcriptional regulator YiaG [Variovorax boronicumulans]MDP9993896.1 DNA-binding transcriptional regulator YiaG [Variovorax boronicumulans]MDQ0005241.1 DNA-binding transcriptional regulator YiaG [Variovorax boronicumulans]MDQ0056867.1 DNA-binding transcriptional regulator YiaG [Variovorax boronicumulans]